MNQKITIYERWFKDEFGNVIQEKYILKNGERKIISSEKTPYLDPPFVILGKGNLISND